jgi:hypothetical protein
LPDRVVAALIVAACEANRAFNSAASLAALQNFTICRRVGLSFHGHLKSYVVLINNVVI